jgi:hypothetical protein
MGQLHQQRSRSAEEEDELAVDPTDDGVVGEQPSARRQNPSTGMRSCWDAYSAQHGSSSVNRPVRRGPPTSGLTLTT